MWFAPLLVVFLSSVAALPVPLLDPGSRLQAVPEKAVLPHDSISPFSDPEKSVQSLDASSLLSDAATVLAHSIESSDSRVKRAIDEPDSEKDASLSLDEIVIPPMPTDASESAPSLEIVHHTQNETVVDLESALSLDPPFEVGTPLLSLNNSDITVAPETAHSLDAPIESTVTTPEYNQTDVSSNATLELVAATLSNETALPVTTPASELGIRALLPLLPDLLNLIPVQNSSFDSFWKQSKINYAVSSYVMNLFGHRR